tara:strand:+ start:131 stop:952 length:822 start_codon:yes stop_codon:yes gene_type:complete
MSTTENLPNQEASVTFEQFRKILEILLPKNGRPVVAYAGVWSIAKAFQVPPRKVVKNIYEILLQVVGVERTLLMPCYTQGFKNGVIDLDQELGTTGVINEMLRKHPDSRRTISAFFSFAALGPQAKEVSELKPLNAWGENSLFEWIERHDSHILTIGEPWRMCSFLHRLEWLAQVPYRYSKSFTGEFIRDAQRHALTERLFVRHLDPLVKNTWPGLEGILRKGGMRSFPLGVRQIAEIGARAMIDSLMPIIEKDPFAFVQTPDKIRTFFQSRS